MGETEVPSIIRADSYVAKVVDGEDVLQDDAYSESLSSSFAKIEMKSEYQIFNGPNSQHFDKLNIKREK